MIIRMRKYFILSDFQNFLRTQTGNTTTVNIIISTVDYLLRLQVCKKNKTNKQKKKATICAPSPLSTNVILLFRNLSVTSTGTTLAKMSLMRLEN